MKKAARIIKGAGILVICLLFACQAFAADIPLLDGYDDLTVVKLTGNSREKGLQYGRAVKDDIIYNLKLFWKQADIKGFSRQAFLDDAVASEGRLPAAMKEELKGIAESSGTDYIELLAMNIYGDPMNQHACTVFVAAGEGSIDGKVIASKNRDESGKEVLVVMEATDDSYGFIAVGAAGQWGVAFGLNDVGLCTGNTWMPVPEYYEDGLEYLTINRLILEKCRSVEESIQFIDDIPKSSGSTFMVADTVKAAFIESVPSIYTPDIVAKIVDNTSDVHTNHYIYEPYYSWVIEDGFGYVWTPSLARYDRGLELLEENNYQVTLEKVIAFTRDLENFGNGHVKDLKEAHPELPNDVFVNGWPGFSICNARTITVGVFEMDADYPSDLSVMWTAINNPAYCAFVPLHNAITRNIELVEDSLASYIDGTAWELSSAVKDTDLYEWGDLIPGFEAWEASIMISVDAYEAEAINLMLGGEYDEALRLLTENDVTLAVEGLDLLEALMP